MSCIEVGHGGAGARRATARDPCVLRVSSPPLLTVAAARAWLPARWRAARNWAARQRAGRRQPPAGQATPSPRGPVDPPVPLSTAALPARARHAQFYLTLAQQAAPEAPLAGADLAQARQAWTWVRQHADPAFVRSYVQHLTPQLEARALRHEILAWAQRDLGAARVLGHDTEELFCLLYLGTAYEDLGQFQPALACYREALPLADRNAINQRAKGLVLGKLGAVYERVGDYRRAEEHLSLALTDAQETQHAASEAVWASILGHLRVRLGAIEQAIAVHQAALARAEAGGDRPGEAGAWQDLGDSHAEAGDLPEAAHCYEQARGVALALESPAREAQALAALAVLALRRADPATARAYHAQLLATVARIAGLRERGQVLGGLGLRYADVQAYRPAAELHQLQITLAQEIGDPREEGLARAYLGQALFALGHRVEAMQSYEAALALLRQVGDRDNEARTLIGLARLYEARQRPDDALRYYDSALALAEDLGDTRLTAEARQARAGIPALLATPPVDKVLLRVPPSKPQEAVRLDLSASPSNADQLAGVKWTAKGSAKPAWTPERYRNGPAAGET